MQKVGCNTTKDFSKVYILKHLHFILIMAKKGILRVFVCEETPSLAFLAGK